MQVRRLTITTSVICSAAFQLIIALREENQWDPLKQGRCYVRDALGSDFGQNMFWFLGTCLYGLILALGCTASTRRWFDEQVLGRVEPSLHALGMWMRESHQAWKKHSRNHDAASSHSTLSGKIRHFSTSCFFWVHERHPTPSRSGLGGARSNSCPSGPRALGHIYSRCSCTVSSPRQIRGGLSRSKSITCTSWSGMRVNGPLHRHCLCVLWYWLCFTSSMLWRGYLGQGRKGGKSEMKKKGAGGGNSSATARCIGVNLRVLRKGGFERSVHAYNDIFECNEIPL